MIYFFLEANGYFFKNADVCIPETPPPLESANVCNWVPPPPLKIADVLCGRPLFRFFKIPCSDIIELQNYLFPNKVSANDQI